MTWHTHLVIINMIWYNPGCPIWPTMSWLVQFSMTWTDLIESSCYNQYYLIWPNCTIWITMSMLVELNISWPDLIDSSCHKQYDLTWNNCPIWPNMSWLMKYNMILPDITWPDLVSYLCIKLLRNGNPWIIHIVMECD